MTLALLTVAISLAPTPTAAMPDTLEDLKWRNRLLVVVHNEASRSTLEHQLEEWQAHADEAADRELLLITVDAKGTGTINAAPLGPTSVTEVLERFRPGESDFLVVLVGKDGTEKNRWHKPVPMAQVFLLIDAMPMRQREMRERSASRNDG